MNWWSLIPIIGALLDKIIPDKDAARRAREELERMAAQGELSLDLEQIRANATQALNPSLFISGPRPFIMWVCSIAMAIYGFQKLILAPSIALLSLFGLNTELVLQIHAIINGIDIGPFMTLLLPLLGLGFTTRTFEKYLGVNNQHG